MMPQNKKRALALCLGLLMTLTCLFGCEGAMNPDPSQTDPTSADTSPNATTPSGKEDPMLPSIRPGTADADNVMQLRVMNMRTGWKEAFRTKKGTFLLVDSVNALKDGLSRRGIKVEELDLSAYDEGFFAQNRLVVIPRSSSSGSVRYSAKIHQNGTEVLIATVGKMPQIGTSDMADWLVLVPLAIGEYDGEVTVEDGKGIPTKTQRYAIHRF